MKIKRVVLRFAVIVLSVVLLAARASADTIHFSVTVPTTLLSGNLLYIDFQLTNGDGVNNSTVMLTNFDFAGGSGEGAPILMGGASGDLTGTVTLTDTSFLNDFLQVFTPGSSFSFDAHLTTSFAGGTPDLFSFAILDSAFREIPTTDPFGTNLLVRVNIDSGTPTVERFQPVPEPSTWLMLASGLVGVATAVRRRRNSNAGGTKGVAAPVVFK